MMYKKTQLLKKEVAFAKRIRIHSDHSTAYIYQPNPSYASLSSCCSIKENPPLKILPTPYAHRWLKSIDLLPVPTVMNSLNRSGFALIVAISLVAFLFMIVIGLSSLLMIEARTAESTSQKVQARQNAIFGLSVAVGELQRLTGPDQRVTARADITEDFADATAEDRSLPSTLPNPNYTAVWNVEPKAPEGIELSDWPAVPGYSPTADFQQAPIYLVSGNEGQTWGMTKAQAEAEYTTARTVALENEIEFTEAGVKVNGVEIPNRDGFEGGLYGWWVGDEGIKARLNRTNTLSEAAANAEAPWTRSEGPTPQVLNGDLRSLDKDGFLTRARPLESIADLSLLGSEFSGFSDPDPELESPYYDDFTLSSLGLLVDTRNGGLKRDLSSVFRGAPGSLPAEIATNKNIFPLQPEDNTSAYRIYEPTWGYLHDYVRGVTTTTAGGAIVLNDEGWANDKIVEMRMPDEDKPGILPVLINTKLSISPFLVPVEVNPGEPQKWTVYMRTGASIVLWNPYDVALKLPDLKALPWSYSGSGDINIGRDTQSLYIEIAEKGITNMDHPADRAMPRMLFRIPSTVIPAGRAVVFSPESGSEVLDSNSAGNILKPGWRPDGSFVYKATDSFEWDPDTADNPRLGLNSNAGANSTYRYGALRGSGGSWAILNTEKTTGYAQSSEVVAQVIGNFFLNAGNATRPYLKTLPRYGTPLDDIPEYAGTFPPVGFTQMLSMKFGSEQGQDTITTFPYNKGPIQWASLYNPRPEFSSGMMRIGGIDMPSIYSMALYLNRESASIYDNISLANDDNNADPTFVVVGSTWSDYDSGRAALFHLPVENESVYNLASLQHVNMASSRKRPMGGGAPRGGQQYAPAYTIGNSLLTPLIAPETTGVHSDRSYGANSRFFLPDMSYLANEALYDRYFFSEVDGGSGESRNPLYFQYSEKVATNSSTGFEQNAAAYMVDGAFNINSTSVEAWAAFLAGALDQQVKLANGSLDSGAGLPQGRLMNPVAQEILESELKSGHHALVKGFRRLKDDEIRALAEQIVEEVKIRGPFPSLSAFVNRSRGDPEGDWSVDRPVYRDDIPSLERKQAVVSKGSLQAALDTAGTNMPNNLLLTDADAETDIASHFTNALNPATVDSVATQGMPGYVMQADLLSTFDSTMTARSDTFRILAYGEARDPLTGEARSMARCEAIVQRLPEYIDANDEAWKDPYTVTGDNNLVSSINSALGRRYRVVSFRWIN